MARLGATQPCLFPTTANKWWLMKYLNKKGCPTQTRFQDGMEQLVGRNWEYRCAGCANIYKPGNLWPYRLFVLGEAEQLFLEDGSRNAGNRRTTPLEVDHPKDVAAFHARSTNCPWAKPNLQVTLERASDPMALHALLDDVAPKRPLKVKRVDGQCEACYAAHVALAARLRALKNPKAKGAAGGDVDA